jgi:Lon protease-like protein
MSSSSREIPLFPLRTVLFPGGPLALKIFEPRYLDMVARCLGGDDRFGVVAIRFGSEVGAAETFDVGTLAAIVDWHQDAGGLLGLTAVGHERFKLEQAVRQRDGLYVGRVVLLDPEPRVPLPPEHAPLASLLRKLLGALPAYRELAAAYDDAVWVGYRLAEVLPLPLSIKQGLIETSDAIARLERLAASLATQPRSE